MSDCHMTELWTYEMIYICMYALYISGSEIICRILCLLLLDLSHFCIVLEIDESTIICMIFWTNKLN